MPPTLEDIISLPTDPGPEHLAALGLLRQPISPVTNAAPTTVAPMSPVVPKPIAPYDPNKPMHAENSGRDADFAIGATTQPTLPRLGPHPNPVAPMIAPKLNPGTPIPSTQGVPAAPSGPAAPNAETLPGGAHVRYVPTDTSVAQLTPPDATGWRHPVSAPPAAGAVAPMVPPTASNVEAPDLAPVLNPGEGLPSLGGPKPVTAKDSIAAGIAQHGGTEKEEGKRQYQDLRPEVTAAPGSADFYQQKVAQAEFDKLHPWGSDISAHPGFLGKLGHVAAKIGNTALDVAAPAVAVNIPGTELNKRVQETANEEKGAAAQQRETSEAAEANKETHEENIHDTNQQKIDQIEEKIDQAERKNHSTREIALRKSGLKPDPENPDGPPIPLTVDDMSETEKDVHNLKAAQAEAQNAKAELDKVKADPDSPQSKATLARIRVMAQNAGTAAAKLGLDKEKFVADYFGIDKDGNPLPGVKTDENGKAVGPRVANSGGKQLAEFNKNYVKPAEDVEKSYQMMEHAYKEYQDAKAQGKDLPTGAQSMLALSTHLTTTFGNVKGARVTKDMIEHHLGARGISDSALVAVQRFTNGDTLSPDQWDAFHDLIGQSRKLSWQTAVKEGKRAKQPIDFLPEDLEGELNKGTKAAKPNGAANPSNFPKEPPGPPAAGMKWQQNKKTGKFRQAPI